MDRCDPAEILAVLDEVEAQLIIGDIEFLPTSGGNAEQMDLDLFAGFQTGQILVPISLKEMDTADLFALISADVETFILKIFYQGVGAFVNMALENRSCQIVKCNIDRIDNGNRLLAVVCQIKGNLKKLYLITKGNNAVIVRGSNITNGGSTESVHLYRKTVRSGDRGVWSDGATPNSTTAASEQGARGSGQNGHGAAFHKVTARKLDRHIR